MTSNTNLAYHRFLEEVAKADIDYVRKKDTQYNASWKRREGPGAFFTMARPWDRLENIASNAAMSYDIFGVLQSEGLTGPDGSFIACVRDLRRYLLLLECEAMDRQLTTDKAFNNQVDAATKPFEANPWPEVIHATAQPTAEPAPSPYQWSGIPDHKEVKDMPSAEKPYTHQLIPEKPVANKLLPTGLPMYLDRPCYDLTDGLALHFLPGVTHLYGTGHKTIDGDRYIVDRDGQLFQTYPELIAHLPRLELELNHKEWSCIPEYYHHMYEWISGETKYRLKPEYQNPRWMKS